MFYKGHVIRDASQISGKIKGQRLVFPEKIGDNWIVFAALISIVKFTFALILSSKSFELSIHSEKGYFIQALWLHFLSGCPDWYLVLFIRDRTIVFRQKNKGQIRDSTSQNYEKFKGQD